MRLQGLGLQGEPRPLACAKAIVCVLLMLTKSHCSTVIVSRKYFLFWRNVSIKHYKTIVIVELVAPFRSFAVFGFVFFLLRAFQGDAVAQHILGMMPLRLQFCFLQKLKKCCAFQLDVHPVFVFAKSSQAMSSKGDMRNSLNNIYIYPYCRKHV